MGPALVADIPIGLLRTVAALKSVQFIVPEYGRQTYRWENNAPPPGPAAAPEDPWAAQWRVGVDVQPGLYVV